MPDESESLQPGDIVYLKSGSRAMTLTSLPEAMDAKLVYAPDGYNIGTLAIPVIALTKTKPA